ncbi:MAG: tetraacyldisaccharide 4'-kinase [Pseudomonadota bacterium]
MKEWIQSFWYRDEKPPLLLRGFALIFQTIVVMRRWAYKLHLLRVYRPPVLVVVVGNINVGGTGKTPATTWVVQMLKKAGFNPAIVSRGYGGRAIHWPQQVRPDSDPEVVGDEAILLARRCQVPMAVGPNRKLAIQELLKHTSINVIVMDDGLQHYAVARDIEIAVIDGQRRFGNGHCLPAGPLREPLSRLRKTHFLVNNGGDPKDAEFPMLLTIDKVVNVADPSQQRTLESFNDTPVHAVAGIGNPQRFFRQLTAFGLQVAPHSFPDHHAFEPEDLAFNDSNPILMTEKDAVKCERFAAGHYWYVTVDAKLPSEFEQQLLDALYRCITGRKNKWTVNYSPS